VYNTIFIDNRIRGFGDYALYIIQIYVLLTYLANGVFVRFLQPALAYTRMLKDTCHQNR